MKWIKKIARTPLDGLAHVINSWTSGDSKTTNAPSIKIVSDKFADVNSQINDLGHNIWDMRQDILDTTGRISQKILVGTVAQSGSVFQTDTITLENGVYLCFLTLETAIDFSAGAINPYVLGTSATMTYIEGNTTYTAGDVWSTSRISTYYNAQGAIRGTSRETTTKVFPVVVSDVDKTFTLTLTDTTIMYDNANGDVTATFNFLRLHEQASS